jgi:hypothetical protein
MLLYFASRHGRTAPLTGAPPPCSEPVPCP